MSDDKYLWRIGCPPPILDRHSEVKHKIVEGYVRRYIMTLMSQATIPALHLSLIDGFSGGGCYQHENGGLVDGSPVLMMRAVHEARALLNLGRRTPREVNADYHFIDLLPDTTAYLKFWLDAKRQEGILVDHDYRRTQITTGDFLAALPRVIKQIQEKRMGEHAIFVLDQYNYHDLPLPDIARILETLRGAEVILTFNVGSLFTYLSDRAANRKPLARIGLENYIPWADLKTLKATEKRRWRHILQRHVAHGIKEVTKAKFMTLFFVRPFGATPWDYWLIHLSNRYRAHDVMKALHWEHSTEFAHELEPGVFMLGYDANADEDYTGQPSFIQGGVRRRGTGTFW
jgi:three-Cys-motif partner protein